MSQHLPATMEDIPASLVDVAETFGMNTVLMLIARFGGQEIKFPKVPKDDHPIIDVFGQEHGRAVSDFLAGVTIYIPHMRKRSQAETARLVRELEAKGLKRAEISERIGVTARQVRRAVNSEPYRDPNQLDMFSED